MTSAQVFDRSKNAVALVGYLTNYTKRNSDLFSKGCTMISQTSSRELFDEIHCDIYIEVKIFSGK